jgi:hypothetical protein
VVFGTTDIAVIAELILHLAEKDAARIHIGLSQDTRSVSFNT